MHLNLIVQANLHCQEREHQMPRGEVSACPELSSSLLRTATPALGIPEQGRWNRFSP